jgi:hypothetical protein
VEKFLLYILSGLRAIIAPFCEVRADLRVKTGPEHISSGVRAPTYQPISLQKNKHISKNTQLIMML